MPRSIFMTTMTNGTPDLPPHEAEDGGLQLNYVDDGVLRGGYSCVGQVPGDVGSILVQVTASDETLDAMAAGDYVFIEDVEEPALESISLVNAPSLQQPKRRKKRQFNRGKALQFLLSHGHAADLAHTFPGAVADAIHKIQELHNITPEEWRYAHG